METVYDILLNFKKNPYEFYEWEQNDNIRHIKKIPAYKVDNTTILDFMKNDVVIDKGILNEIENKTEIFTIKGIKKINYACLLYSNDMVLAIFFDDNGLNAGKSKLLFDESDDTIKKGLKNKVNKINYKIIKKNYHNELLTRQEQKASYLSLKYLDKIYNEKRIDELNYLFYESFNNESNSYIYSYEKLKRTIEEGNLKTINIIKNLIKISKS